MGWLLLFSTANVVFSGPRPSWYLIKTENEHYLANLNEDDKFLAIHKDKIRPATKGPKQDTDRKPKKSYPWKAKDTNELDHDDSEVVYEYYERMRDHEEKDIDFEDNERRGYRGKKPRKEKKMREERKHDQINGNKEKKKEQTENYIKEAKTKPAYNYKEKQNPITEEQNPKTEKQNDETENVHSDEYDEENFDTEHDETERNGERGQGKQRYRSMNIGEIGEKDVEKDAKIGEIGENNVETDEKMLEAGQRRIVGTDENIDERGKRI